MRIVIDRFEGDYAICEKDDRTMINIEVARLPQDAGEGDVLIVDGDNVDIDHEETNRRKLKNQKLIDDLWK